MLGQERIRCNKANSKTFNNVLPSSILLILADINSEMPKEKSAKNQIRKKTIYITEFFSTFENTVTVDSLANKMICFVNSSMSEY